MKQRESQGQRKLGVPTVEIIVRLFRRCHENCHAMLPLLVSNAIITLRASVFHHSYRDVLTCESADKMKVRLRNYTKSISKHMPMVQNYVKCSHFK